MNATITTSAIGTRVIAVADCAGREFTMHKDVRPGADVGQVHRQVVSKLTERLAEQGISVTTVERTQ